MRNGWVMETIKVGGQDYTFPVTSEGYIARNTNLPPAIAPIIEREWKLHKFRRAQRARQRQHEVAKRQERALAMRATA